MALLNFYLCFKMRDVTGKIMHLPSLQKGTSLSHGGGESKSLYDSHHSAYNNHTHSIEITASHSFHSQ